MTAEALRAVREKIQELGETVTFADLSEDLLLDVALGWHQGRPFAAHVADMLSRIDGIPPERRIRELVGRALLTVLARRRAGVSVDVPADQVRLLADPEVDEGDAEGERAFERREAEYRSLSELTPPYGADDFLRDATAAFTAARERAEEARSLGPDPIGQDHKLALLGQSLPPGIRLYFRERHGEQRGDAVAWRFVLTARALARHRDEMDRAGVLEGGGTMIPRKLLDALLATDLGELARTAVFE